MTALRTLALWLVLWLAAAPGPLHAQDLDDLDDFAGDEDDDASDSSGDDEDDDSDDGSDDGDEQASEPDEEDELEESDGSDGSDGDAAAEAVDADASARGLGVRVGGGLGAGTFSYERTRGLTRDVLDTSPMAVAEAMLALRFWPDDALSLAVELAYQTSVGFRLALEPQFGLPEKLNARFQRGQLRAVPLLRLGDGPLSLGLPVGFGFQALTTQVHQYTVPGFVLAGATFGVDVHVRVADWLAITAGPGAEWLFILGSELPDEGVCCQGLALGGHASFDMHVSQVLRASIAYQETHTSVPTFDDRFVSVTRMLTARLLGEM